MRIRNFGAGTPKLNEGMITSGSAATDFHAVYASGSIRSETLLLDDIQPVIQFKEDGSDRAEILINDSDNLLLTNQSMNRFIVFKTNDQGSVKEGLRIGGPDPEVVVNEGSDSLINFRVESENNTHMLFVTGSDRVGIGTDTPIARLHVSNNSTGDLLFLETTDASNVASPVIKLKRNSNTPADADYLGQLKFQGENNASQNVTYAKITGKIGSVTDGSEQGIIEFANMKNGSSGITARLRHDSLQLVNSTNLTVDGDVGIGNTSPDDALDVTGNVRVSNYLRLNCQNTVDPTGSPPLLNHAHIYSKLTGGRAEIFVQDSDSNVTQISPHNPKGEWHYFSRNTRTGKVVRVNMEKMIRKLEEITGESFMEEWYEDI